MFQINTREMFKLYPFNEWIPYSAIPKACFQAFYTIIDEPALRPGIQIFENAEYTHFKKMKK